MQELLVSGAGKTIAIASIEEPTGAQNFATGLYDRYIETFSTIKALPSSAKLEVQGSAAGLISSLGPSRL